MSAPLTPRVTVKYSADGQRAWLVVDGIERGHQATKSDAEYLAKTFNSDPFALSAFLASQELKD